MKLISIVLFSIIVISCTKGATPAIKKGECVLGQEMLVWKLLRKEDGRFLFVEMPETEQAKVHLVDDVSAFKRIECPTL